jgi:hypothetical protein
MAVHVYVLVLLCQAAGTSRPASRGGITGRVFFLLAGVALPFPVRPPVLPLRPTLAGAHLPALSSRYDDTSLPPRRGAQVHARQPASRPPPLPASARIAARSQRTPCLHVPAGDAIIRPACPRLLASPETAATPKPLAVFSLISSCPTRVGRGRVSE